MGWTDKIAFLARDSEQKTVGAQGDAGKSIYTDFLTFQIIPHLDQYYQYQYDQCQYRHSCCYQYQYDQCQYRHCLLLLSVSTERVEQRLTRELQRAAST